ncbi:MAG: hypothetical protein HKP59_02310 [Lutibacter sp.]|uniref:hypothetical protein n=1 Tax=Lutibacter sp. TaxID=1925666 RepID=UPI0017DE6D0F|nr:hypothetical protein [Lutibacter sp.]MBT8316437.1 hypothetical protein [Lutibacter sp.]NNJ57297.1 hypothetical protein [Lutibacter sp.]
MNQYKNHSFFKIAFRFAFIFLVFVSFIEIGFSILTNVSFSIMIEKLFSEGKWVYFLKRLVAMSSFYGLFMAGYYKFIKK